AASSPVEKPTRARDGTLEARWRSTCANSPGGIFAAQPAQWLSDVRRGNASCDRACCMSGEAITRLGCRGSKSDSDVLLLDEPQQRLGHHHVVLGRMLQNPLEAPPVGSQLHNFQ